MTTIRTFASGSSGNAALLSCGETHLLIDMGISCRRICQSLAALGLTPGNLAGILITHEHVDHVNGLAVLCKQTDAPLYTAEPTAFALCEKWSGLTERFRVFAPGQRFDLNGLEVGTFANSHDCACPVGFTVSDGKRKLALCTDTGVVTQGALDAVRGADTLIGEFNYDLEMLRAGPYPPYLKERILGNRGHLSNELGGELAGRAVEAGTRRVELAHLSKETNRPELAQEAARQALDRVGARVGTDVELIAAPRSECSGWFEV